MTQFKYGLYYLIGFLLLTGILLITDETIEGIFILFLIGVGAFLFLDVLKKYKEYKLIIEKAFFISSFWFMASVILLDINEIDLHMSFKLVTSFVYIFLACFIPEYISRGKEKDIQKEKE